MLALFSADPKHLWQLRRIRMFPSSCWFSSHVDWSVQFFRHLSILHCIFFYTVGASLRCGCSYTRRSFAMFFRLLIFMCTLNNLIYRPFLRSDIRVIDAMMVCSTCLSGNPSFHFYWPASSYGCSIFVACWTCVCILFFFSASNHGMATLE